LAQKTKGKLIYKANDENCHDDKYFGPRIYEVGSEDPLMQEEIFGPILSILPVKNFEEGVKFINQGEKPLGAYIFSDDQSKIERFFDEVHCGNAVANGVGLNYGCEL
jgi:acyl-CoA reductase-like NAD-dependent aldehyde dehydrogenase